MPDGYMNPSYGRLMTEGGKQADKQEPGPEARGEAGKRSKENAPPSIHIHSHTGGHTVHILHKDGRHEMHQHGHGDTDGISQHIQTHLGAGSAPESAPLGMDEEAAIGER